MLDIISRGSIRSSIYNYDDTNLNETGNKVMADSLKV